MNCIRIAKFLSHIRACTQVGKEFDALLVDVKAPKCHPVFDIFDQDSFDVRQNKRLCTVHDHCHSDYLFILYLYVIQDILMKFLYLCELAI